MEEVLIRKDESFRKVEIFVSCRNLSDKDLFSKISPYIVFYAKNDFTNKWEELGRTEIIKNQ